MGRDADGYGKTPTKPHFNHLPNVIFVRIFDKVSTRGVRQKRAVIVSPAILVVSDATAFNVRRFVDVRHIAGAYRQYGMHNDAGKADCAVLLSMSSSSREHDLLLCQPSQRKAGYASLECMTEFLRAVTLAKSYYAERLPIRTLPRGDERSKSRRDDILDHCCLVKDPDSKPCKESLITLLETRRPPQQLPTPPPLPPTHQHLDSPHSNAADDTDIRVGKKVSFASGVLDGAQGDSSAMGDNFPVVDGTDGGDTSGDCMDSSISLMPLMSPTGDSPLNAAGKMTPWGLRTAWEADTTRDDCFLCLSRFTMTRRRHHCRRCGKLVCEKCTPNKASVSGYEQPQRVCTKCYADIVMSSVVDSGHGEAVGGNDGGEDDANGDAEGNANAADGSEDPTTAGNVDPAERSSPTLGNGGSSAASGSSQHEGAEGAGGGDSGDRRSEASSGRSGRRGELRASRRSSGSGRRERDRDRDSSRGRSRSRSRSRRGKSRDRDHRKARSRSRDGQAAHAAAHPHLLHASSGDGGGGGFPPYGGIPRTPPYPPGPWGAPPVGSYATSGPLPHTYALHHPHPHHPLLGIAPGPPAYDTGYLSPAPLSPLSSPHVHSAYAGPRGPPYPSAASYGVPAAPVAPPRTPGGSAAGGGGAAAAGTKDAFWAAFVDEYDTTARAFAAFDARQAATVDDVML